MIADLEHVDLGYALVLYSVPTGRHEWLSCSHHVGTANKDVEPAHFPIPAGDFRGSQRLGKRWRDAATRGKRWNTGRKLEFSLDIAGARLTLTVES